MPTLPALKMLPGMMPILQAPGVITPGQLGPISATWSRERALHLDHVEHGNAFRDAHDQRDPRVDGFHDGVGGERRRHVDHGRGGAGLCIAPRCTVSKIGTLAVWIGCFVPPLPGVTPPTIFVP